MEIDESRSDDQTFSVDRGISALNSAESRDFCDSSVLQQNVSRLIDLLRWIHQVSAADEKALAHRRPPSRELRIAIRTFTPLSTCSSTTDCGWSATSSVNSMPRIIGPGCMMIASFFASFTRDTVN